MIHSLPKTAEFGVHSASPHHPPSLLVQESLSGCVFPVVTGKDEAGSCSWGKFHSCTMEGLRNCCGTVPLELVLAECVTVRKGPGDRLSLKTGTPGEFQEPLSGSEAPHFQASPPGIVWLVGLFWQHMSKAQKLRTVHTCNLSTWMEQAGRSGVQGQPQTHNRFEAI